MEIMQECRTTYALLTFVFTCYFLFTFMFDCTLIISKAENMMCIKVDCTYGHIPHRYFTTIHVLRSLDMIRY